MNWKLSADGSPRIDFADDFAPSFPLVWGYVDRIDESPFASTLISYSFDQIESVLAFLMRTTLILDTVLKSSSVFLSGSKTSDFRMRRQAGRMPGCGPIAPTR